MEEEYGWAQHNRNGETFVSSVWKLKLVTAEPCVIMNSKLACVGRVLPVAEASDEFKVSARSD